MRDALGVLHRVRDRDRAAARDAEERKSIETSRIDDGFEIADPRVEAARRRRRVATCRCRARRSG